MAFSQSITTGDVTGTVTDATGAVVPGASVTIKSVGTNEARTELTNSSNTPALTVRVKAVREKTGDRILPAIYGDNYIALMPGEKRSIRTELEDADARGEKPAIVVEGFNLAGVDAK